MPSSHMESDRLLGRVHPSWEPMLDKDTLQSLLDIGKAIGADCLPDPGQILRFLRTDMNLLQIVILGQDPYPGPGAATGRAFEVGGLKSWLEPFRQVSLKNIIRLVWCADHGIRPFDGAGEYERIPPFSQIRAALSGDLPALAAPDLLFRSWESQGVLLLNASLSVSPGRPGTHRELWAPFTQRVLRYLGANRPDIVWFLWGSHARLHARLLGKAAIFQSRHPMLCSSSFQDDFFRNPCFHETTGLVDWTGSRLGYGKQENAAAASTGTRPERDNCTVPPAVI